MHNAFYEIIDTGFIVLTPLISILFTLGQFVAQNHTISVTGLFFEKGKGEQAKTEKNEEAQIS